MKYKNIAYTLISIVLIAAPVFFVLNLFYYIDPVNQCFIRTDNKSDATRKALKYTKENSKDDYKMICRNLSKVVETVCNTADWNLYPGAGSGEIGCYLRGTKIAFLKPSGTTKLDSEALAKFARFSRDYWD